MNKKLMFIILIDICMTVCLLILMPYSTDIDCYGNDSAYGRFHDKRDIVVKSFI